MKSNTHELTHHGHRQEKSASCASSRRPSSTTLPTFSRGLRGVSEQGSSLLDRTAVLYGTNMGSANAHSNDNLPTLLVGGGFRHGQHLAFDLKKNYPLTNLHVSLLQRLGVEASGFSSGTGTMRRLEMV